MKADEARVARLLELQRLRIIDSEPEQEFDGIVNTAATVFDAPIALVTILDDRRQWFKATHGLGLRETPIEIAFCSVAISTPNAVMIVPDATRDSRFAFNPLVTGELGIRFYAGAPLLSRNGIALGTLCIIDRVARDFSQRDAHALRTLAEIAAKLIEQRADSAAIARDSLAKRVPDTTPCSVFNWDREGRVTSWSRAAQTMFGWTAAETVGSYPPLILLEDIDDFRRDCDATLGGTDDVVRLATVRTKDDRRLTASLTITRGVGADGRRSGVAIVKDIGARVDTERRLAMFESAIVNSTDAVVVTDAFPVRGQRRIIYVNAAFTEMTGYTAEEAIGNSPRMLQGPDTDPLEVQRIAAALERSERVSAELKNYRKDGSEFWVEFKISPVLESDGSCEYFVAVQRDTTQRRAIEQYDNERSSVLEMAICNEPIEEQLARIVMLLRGVIPGSRCTLMLLDGDELAVRAADPNVPQRFLQALEGLRAAGNCGVFAAAVQQRASVLCADIATDARWREHRDAALDAGFRACWSLPIADTKGGVMGVFALYLERDGEPSLRDRKWLQETVHFASLVIGRYRDRERLEQTVLRDALTELPNRTSFDSVCAEAIARAGARGEAVVLGVLDIDRFKTINDAFGHRVGDELLRQIASRLSSSVRSSDMVARMSGDEFLIVFADLADSGDGISAARRLISRFDQAFVVDGHEIFVRPSVGLALYPDTSTDIVSLRQAADRAMLAAKSHGGGLEVATNLAPESALEKLDLENDMHHALARGEFELHFQMMFDLDDGRPVGAEALLRWNHPQLGRVAPNDFIPLAEANGSIVQIGAWVIGEAARVARAWQDQGRDAFVTVNMSAMQLDDPGLIATVADAIQAHGLEPHRLHLELTESLVMRNAGAAATILQQLKGLGVQIDIDDFGTGYSSLAYLQRFSFDALKIDRAFVRGIGEDPNGRSEQIVTAVVGLGKALGVQIIVEGIETAAQYEFVQSCGCDIVQGFLCARPVPTGDIVWNRWDKARAQPV